MIDFRKRISNYASVYEPIDEVLDSNLSYITLANMGNHCKLNKVFGTITTVVVPFLVALHVALRPIWFFTVNEETARTQNLAECVSGWLRTAIWMRSQRRLDLTRRDSLGSLKSEDGMETPDDDDIEQVPIFTPSSQAVKDAAFSVSTFVDGSHEDLFRLVHKIRPALDPRAEDDDHSVLAARLVPLVIELEQQTGPALVFAGPKCTKALLAYFLRSEKLLERSLTKVGSSIIELIPDQGGNWKETQHDLE